MLAVAALFLLVSYLVSSVDGKSFSFFLTPAVCLSSSVKVSSSIIITYLRRSVREKGDWSAAQKRESKKKNIFWGKSDKRRAPACSSPQGDGSITLDGLAARSRTLFFLIYPEGVTLYVKIFCQLFFWLFFTFHFCWKVRLLYNIDSFVFFKVYYISIVWIKKTI